MSIERGVQTGDIVDGAVDGNPARVSAIVFLNLVPSQRHDGGLVYTGLDGWRSWRERQSSFDISWSCGCVWTLPGILPAGDIPEMAIRRGETAWGCRRIIVGASYFVLQDSDRTFSPHASSRTISRSFGAQ